MQAVNQNIRINRHPGLSATYVTETTEYVAPHEISRSISLTYTFLGILSCRPMTKTSQAKENEAMPAEDTIQLEATLPSSTHENEPVGMLEPDHEPFPQPEPTATGSAPVRVPEIEIELQPQPVQEVEVEPEPEGVVEPQCDEEKGVVKT